MADFPIKDTRVPPEVPGGHAHHTADVNESQVSERPGDMLEEGHAGHGVSSSSVGEHEGGAEMVGHRQDEVALQGLPPARPQETVDLTTRKAGHAVHMSMSQVRTKVGDADMVGVAYGLLGSGGSIPGPLIKIREGSWFKAVIHNEYSRQTLVHWHGFPGLPNEFDGSPLTQDPIQPGEQFVYKIPGNVPGLHPFHPHVEDWLGRRLGAVGVVLVEPINPDYYPPAHRTEVIMLHDVEVKDGHVVTGDPDRPTHVLMGHFGNVMLINGKTDYRLQATAGEILRFHLINPADVRPFNVAILGPDRQTLRLKIVGSDSRRVPEEQFTESVLLSPIERYSVDCFFQKPGEYKIVNQIPGEQPTTLGTVVVQAGACKTLGEDTQKTFEALRTDTKAKSRVEQLVQQYSHEAPDKILAMQVTMRMGEGYEDGSDMEMPDPPGGERAAAPIAQPMGGKAHDMGTMGEEEPSSMAEPPDDLDKPLWLRTKRVEFQDLMAMMNQMSTPDTVVWNLVDIDPQENIELGRDMGIHWRFKKGDVVKIRLRNDADSAHPMHHPIHFHAEPFLPIASNGHPMPFPQFKDTIVVRPGEEIDILVFADNPGKWMTHCHIGAHGGLDHQMRMMTRFDIED